MEQVNFGNDETFHVYEWFALIDSVDELIEKALREAQVQIHNAVIDGEVDVKEGERPWEDAFWLATSAEPKLAESLEERVEELWSETISDALGCFTPDECRGVGFWGEDESPDPHDKPGPGRLFGGILQLGIDKIRWNAIAKALLQRALDRGVRLPHYETNPWRLGANARRDRSTPNGQPAQK